MASRAVASVRGFLHYTRGQVILQEDASIMAMLKFENLKKMALKHTAHSLDLGVNLQGYKCQVG